MACVYNLQCDFWSFGLQSTTKIIAKSTIYKKGMHTPVTVLYGRNTCLDTSIINIDKSKGVLHHIFRIRVCFDSSGYGLMVGLGWVGMVQFGLRW